MAANNEIGTMQPVAEIGALCRERGIVFHSDAVQALGRVPGRRATPGASTCMSLSAHKMYGPKGVGALYVRSERRPRLRLTPQAEGGGQEKGLRSGTLNVPGIVGFGEAARLAQEALARGEPARVARAARSPARAACARASTGIEVNGAMAPRLPGNLHVSIEGAEAETLILSLGGAHRAFRPARPARRPAARARTCCARSVCLTCASTRALRFGVGRYNTAAEIDAVVESLAEPSRARARARPRAAAKTHAERVDSDATSSKRQSRKSHASVRLLSHGANRSKSMSP